MKNNGLTNLVLVGMQHGSKMERSGAGVQFTGGRLDLIVERAKAAGLTVTVHTTPKRPRGKMLGDTWHAS
jgi:hypothetical protein